MLKSISLNANQTHNVFILEWMQFISFFIWLFVALGIAEFFFNIGINTGYTIFIFIFIILTGEVLN